MNRPLLKMEEALAKCRAAGVDQKIMLLGIRGYYKKTMGDPSKNDRGIYDDAIFLITPFLYRSYNANTDPSVKRKNVAVLEPGVYYYTKGLHNISKLNRKRKDHEDIYQRLIKTGKDVAAWPRTYWALRQDSNVTVLRDGSTKPVTDSPENRFWINIHKGSYNTTSSLGCQTIYPDQWEEFRTNVYSEMERVGQKRVPYILI
jgi:lysozyme